MSVTAPPRPPDQSDPMDREELEALVEAVIEEARREQRRRHRRNLSLTAFATLVGSVVLILLDGGAASQTASPAVSARMSSAAQAGTSRIAFLAGVRRSSPTGGYMQSDLYVMNADGSAKRRLVGHGWV